MSESCVQRRTDAPDTNTREKADEPVASPREHDVTDSGQQNELLQLARSGYVRSSQDGAQLEFNDCFGNGQSGDFNIADITRTAGQQAAEGLNAVLKKVEAVKEFTTAVNQAFENLLPAVALDFDASHETDADGHASPTDDEGEKGGDAGGLPPRPGEVDNPIDMDDIEDTAEDINDWLLDDPPDEAKVVQALAKMSKDERMVLAHHYEEEFGIPLEGHIGCHLDGRERDKAIGYLDEGWADDLKTERENLENLTDGMTSDEREEFMADMEKMEEKVRNGELTEHELAEFYHEVGRLLEADGYSPTTPQERETLAIQVMENAANPTMIDQGSNPTCNVTAIETRTYTRSPADAARVVADVAITGQYTAYDGTQVKVDPKPHGVSKNEDADSVRNYASEVFQVATINLHYAKHDSDKAYVYDIEGTGHLVDYSKNPPKDIDESPKLDARELTEISNQITGLDERDVVIGHEKNRGGDDEDITNFKNEEEFNELLKRLKEEGKLPVIIAVHTGNEPFWSDSGKGAAGGAGGPDGGGHVVTITDYNEGPPPTVAVDNQWGSDDDHLTPETQLSVHDLYMATRKPKDTLGDMKDEIEHNRENGIADPYLEFDYLRMKRVVDDGYSAEELERDLLKTFEHVEETWDKVSPEEKERALEKLGQLTENLPPDVKIRILQAQMKAGLIGQREMKDAIVETVAKGLAEYDQKVADDELSKNDKKRYEKLMSEYSAWLAEMPLELAQETVKRVSELRSD